MEQSREHMRRLIADRLLIAKTYSRNQVAHLVLGLTFPFSIRPTHMNAPVAPRNRPATPSAVALRTSCAAASVAGCDGEWRRTDVPIDVSEEERWHDPWRRYRHVW